MSVENNKNSRSSFIKSLSLAFVSILGIGITGLNFGKLQQSIGNRFKSISTKEANKLIANMNSPEAKKIKPMSPPQIN